MAEPLYDRERIKAFSRSEMAGMIQLVLQVSGDLIKHNYNIVKPGSNWLEYAVCAGLVWSRVLPPNAWDTDLKLSLPGGLASQYNQLARVACGACPVAKERIAGRQQPNVTIRGGYPK
jgi:hypothetical protein